LCSGGRCGTGHDGASCDDHGYHTGNRIHTNILLGIPLHVIRSPIVRAAVTHPFRSWSNVRLQHDFLSDNDQWASSIAPPDETMSTDHKTNIEAFLHIVI
jgi:hypothetical protein